MKKIIFIDNSAHHLFGQLHLILAFKESEYMVYALFPFDEKYTHKLQDICECYDLRLDGKSTNPFKELNFLKHLRAVYKKLTPDVICSFTIKPNLYSALATKGLNIPVIAGVTGLGTVFSSKSILKSIVVFLYRFAFSKIGCVFFQNPTDQQTFIESKILNTTSKHYVLPGDGVDLHKFQYVGLTNHNNGVIRFIFSGRLLWDKGLGELVEAIKIVRKKYPATELTVIGNYFFGNPNSIDEDTIRLWHDSGYINYLGMVDNVFEIMSKMDCMVLPSYYMEGLPRVLMEASSMGKPVITVDNVGCRDVVDHSITGYIAKPRDVDSLADAMLQFIELPFEDKQHMGLNGRKKMIAEFDQTIVINKYTEVVDLLIIS